MERAKKEKSILQSGKSQRGRTGSVLAFVFAVTVFFLVGFYVIGPWLQGRTSPETNTIGSNPVTAPRSQPNFSKQHRVPAVSVEITERPSSVGRPSPAQPTQSPEPTVPTVTQSPRQPVHIHPQQSEKPTPSRTQPETAAQSATSDSETPPQKLYRVKAGVFQDRANADALVQKLAQSGFSAKIVTSTTDGAERFTVQVGAFSDRANADELAASLRRSGFDAVISSAE